MITRSHKQLLQQPAQFIKRLSVLLQEGYTFEESIRILSPYHVKDKILFDELLTEAFLTGQTPAEILASIGVKKRFLLAITVAQSTGDLAKTLQKVSEDMQFYEQTRERLKRLLYYPLFLFTFVCLLFVA
ncbi:MAG: type II secretion system F family protein, partial [Lysinibacillus sp.]